MSTSVIQDPSTLRVRGLKNGELLQDCGTEYASPTADIKDFLLMLVPVTVTSFSVSPSL